MTSLALLLPALIGLVVALALGAYVAFARTHPAASAFVRLQFVTVALCLCWTVIAAVDDPGVKFFFEHLRFAAASFVPLAFLSLARGLTQPDGTLPRRWLALLLVGPVANVVLAITSQQHELVYTQLAIDPETGFVHGRFGLWSIPNQLWLWPVALYGEALLVQQALRAPRPTRLRRWLLPTAFVPSITLGVLLYWGAIPVHAYGLPPLAFALAGAVLAHATLRHSAADPRVRFAVVDLIEDVVLVLQPDGRLRDVNRAGMRTLFPTATPALDQPIAVLIPELGPLLERAKKGETLGARVPLACAGGRVFDIKMVHLHEERSEGFAFVMKDETEQQRADQEVQQRLADLEDLSRLKDNLLATVSHELRTPLNSILGHADALLDEELPSAARRYATTLRGSGETLLGLVNDILDLAKAKSGSMAVDLVAFSVAELVSSVAQPFVVECQRRGLGLTWSVKPSACVLLGDTALLRRVLMNLVSNAVKYTDEGTIRIEARFSGGVLRVTVADTGLGIAPEDQARVFDEFVQVHNKSAARVGGTGLGLSIVRRLTALMGGDVQLDSTPGKGARFTLTLPLVESDLPESAAAQENSDVSALTSALVAPAARRRLLLVDDVPENQLLAEAFLKRATVDVDFADDGAAGLEAFRGRRYDAVFLDIEMPVMNGLEAVRQMRAWEREHRLAPTPIVAMTAHRSTDFLADAQSMGFDEALFRPVRKDEFLSAVARLTATPMATGPVVRADGMDWRIEELRRRYLRSLATSFHQLRSSLGAADYIAVGRFGHTLYGTAGSYELRELAALGAEIEAAAKGDEAKLFWLVEQLGRVLAANLDASKRRATERQGTAPESETGR